MTADDRAVDRAIARHRAGDLSGAETLYRAVLEEESGNLAALVNLAAILLCRGDAAGARELSGRAVTRDDRHAPAWNIKGAALARTGDPHGALECYDRALAIDPAFRDAALNRAGALIALGNFDEAVAVCEHLLQRDSSLASAQCILGLALAGLDRLDEALASFSRALERAPDMAEAHNGRADVLRRQGRVEEAVIGFSQAIACNPAFADAYNNRGIAWQYMRCYAEAIADYDAAIARAPAHADAHWNRALVLLLRGDFARGWPEYEWRWRSAAMRGLARDFPAPRWQGEDVAGKTILLHAEQGLGDTLQFCRYAPLVRARGARVILEAPRPLARLLATLDGVDRVITAGDVFPPFDLQCPLLSLPGIFATTVETIPARVPYLAPDPAAVTAWRDRLGVKTGLRVGVVWAGRPGHHNDRNRSLAAEQLVPWRDLPAEFHCLQKEVAPADRSRLAGWMAFHDRALGDLADTAALAAAMDVVVSVDTAVAHLAGALGLPLRLMLPFAADFRWLENREDSPWYPTARIFRQPAPGDWAAVVGGVARDLSSRT